MVVMLALFCSGCSGESFQDQQLVSSENDTNQDGDDDSSSTTVAKISQKCSAILISVGTVGGAGITYAITPVALAAAGFGPIGVSASSFASWWQSTMPAIQSGSLFSALQSAAMTGVGTKVTLAGGVLGSVVSTKFLNQFCAYVDDPDNPLAPVFDATLKTVRTAIIAADKVQETCAASKECSNTVELVQKTSETVSSSLSSIFGLVSDGIGHAASTASNKVEAWKLNRLVKLQKQKLKNLKDKTFGGWLYQQAKDEMWSYSVLDWMTGGTIQKIIMLEEDVHEMELRLEELESHNG